MTRATLTVDIHAYTDDFVRGYITCALWSSAIMCPIGENHEHDDDCQNEVNFDSAGYTAEDLQSSTYESMRSDCEDFIMANWRTLRLLHTSALVSMCEGSQHGHDFWLTRNGHGAGFWDGDYPGSIGDELTAASRPYGTVDLMADGNGGIYL